MGGASGKVAVPAASVAGQRFIVTVRSMMVVVVIVCFGVEPLLTDSTDEGCQRWTRQGHRQGDCATPRSRSAWYVE